MLLLVDDRIEQHHQDSEGRQNQFGQYADVIASLWDRFEQNGGGRVHCPTTLLILCGNGASQACTAGSIAASHKMGATPITRAATAHGHTAAFSNPYRSGRALFTGCVTLP